jgi:rare lipoprotein A
MRYLWDCWLMRLIAERAVPLLLAAACLAACGNAGIASETVVAQTSAPVAPTIVADTPVKLGDPFVIEGVTHTPVDIIDYDDVGYASWYGSEFAGRPTANGEIFSPAAFSAAHKTLPLPSYVEITELVGGRTIVVRVNDRGPMDNRRLIDLSEAAAKALGIDDMPTAVRVRRVNPPASERAQLRAGMAVQERLPTPESLLTVLRAKAAGLPAQASVPSVAVAAPRPIPPTAERVAAERMNDPPAESKSAPTPPAAPPLTVTGPGYIVQVAAFSSQSRAEAAATKVGGKVSAAGNLWRVRIGPFKDEAGARNALTSAKAKGFSDARIMRDR